MQAPSRSAEQRTESNGAVGRLATWVKVEAAGFVQLTWKAKISTRSPPPPNRSPSI
jgi:hypothetical protein